MSKFLVVAVVAATCSAVRADFIPPDTKHIRLDHQIESDDKYPDWVFFVVKGTGDISEVGPGPKSPITIIGDARHYGARRPEDRLALGLSPANRAFVAVPKETAKSYASDEDLRAAVKEGKVPGLLQERSSLYGQTDVRLNDPRTKIVKRHKLVKVDAKEGIVLEDIKAEDESAREGASRLIAAGLALAAGVGFVGLWVTRRRPQVPSA